MVVTVIDSNPFFVGVTENGAAIAVHIRNSSGTRVQQNFSFIVYQNPQVTDAANGGTPGDRGE